MSKYSLLAKFGADTSQFKRGMKGARQTTDQFSSRMKALGGVMAGAFSVRALINFGKQAAELYNIQAQAEAKLTTALDNNVEQFERLKKVAGELQQTTLFGDEKTIEAMSFLAQMKMTETEIRKTIPLIQDFATSQNMDLVSAAQLVAKSFGSSTNALSRYGIEITGAAQSSERAESMIAALNDQVGGQAVAAAEAGTGAYQQLSNSWGDLMETMGKAMLDNDIPGYLQWITEGVNELFKSTEQKIAGEAEDMFKKRIETTLLPQLERRQKELIEAGLSIAEAEKQALQQFIDASAQKIDSANTSLLNATFEGNEAKQGYYNVMMQSWEMTNAHFQGLLDQIIQHKEDVIKREAELSRAITARNAGNQFSTGMSADYSIIGYNKDKDAQAKYHDAIAGAAPELTPGTIDISQIVTPGFVSEYQQMAAKMQGLNEQLGESFKNLAIDMTASFAEGLGAMMSGTVGMGDVLKGLALQFLGFMQTIGKQMVALGMGVKTFKTTLFANPAAAIVAGVGIIALASALKASISNMGELPKLAEGGLAFGPTAAIVGDNPNAYNDPEVIAPLSKLKGMGGNVEVTGEFKMRGTDLVAVVRRTGTRLNTIT